ELRQPLLRLVDQLLALVLLVHGVRDRFDLYLPGNLPVVVLRGMHGDRGDLLEIRSCLLVHLVVHGNDLCGVDRGDLLDDVRGEPFGGVVDRGRFGVAELVARPGTDSGGVGVALRSPGGDGDRGDAQRQERVGVAQTEGRDALFVTAGVGWVVGTAAGAAAEYEGGRQQRRHRGVEPVTCPAGAWTVHVGPPVSLSKTIG